MTSLTFDRNFEARHGQAVILSPDLRRVTCNNSSAFTFHGTNSFIIGRGQVAIVDPGPDNADHLAALLAAVKGETVSHIIVTHSHMDHSPLAAKLKAATGARTHAGLLHAKSVKSSGLEASIDHDFVPDVALHDGDVITGAGWTLESIFTPGHIGNHMAFALREDNALLAGDHVMAWATTVVAPPDGHMGQYMASLRKLLARDEVVYHPAHGPEHRNPASLVRGILAHRKMREEAIFDRVKAGDRRIADIVASIYADVDPSLHGAAALSTEAHLIDLVDNGRIFEAAPGIYIMR